MAAAGEAVATATVPDQPLAASGSLVLGIAADGATKPLLQPVSSGTTGLPHATHVRRWSGR